MLDSNKYLLSFLEEVKEEDKEYYKELMKDIPDNLPLIILGTGPCILDCVRGLLLNDTERHIEFLPSNATHHTMYIYEYRGLLIEFKNPIIITQSKEFIEMIFKDFRNCNFLCASFDPETEKTEYIILNKDEAYNKMYEEGEDLRDYAGKEGKNGPTLRGTTLYDWNIDEEGTNAKENKFIN